ACHERLDRRRGERQRSRQNTYVTYASSHLIFTSLISSGGQSGALSKVQKSPGRTSLKLRFKKIIVYCVPLIEPCVWSPRAGSMRPSVRIFFPFAFTAF